MSQSEKQSIVIVEDEGLIAADLDGGVLRTVPSTSCRVASFVNAPGFHIKSGV